MTDMLDDPAAMNPPGPLPGWFDVDAIVVNALPPPLGPPNPELGCNVAMAGGVLLINVVGIPGDFDGDGDVDADDIDILCDNLGSVDPRYDLDNDGDADEDDMIYHVEELVELTDGSGRVGSKRGDFNLDGFVDGTDLALMKLAFGQPGQNYADGNANCDVFVDGTDLAILKSNIGFIAPTGGVPEPMTLGLMALGGLALLRRKSKTRRGGSQIRLGGSKIPKGK